MNEISQGGQGREGWMKKIERILVFLIAVVIALALVVALVGCLSQEVPPTGGDLSAQAVGVRPLTPYLTYYEETLSADRWVILVDLSDNTNYPHANTNRIILKSLRYAGNHTHAVRWYCRVGVVTAVTTATTDIEWIYGSPIFRSMFFDERWQLPEHGLSLLVTSASLENVATFEVASTAEVTSATEISTTVGVTGTVGVGDLILHTDEISDTGFLHFAVSAGYDTE